MAFFPMFINLEKKNILVVGGGMVASRKIETLIKFNPQKITVVAKKASKFLKKLSKEQEIILYIREFNTDDLKNKDMVIVAVDNMDLQSQIFEICKNKSIPINSVDSPEYCSFIFPSSIVRGEFVIGISTSAKAPAVSKGMRQFLEKIIPDDMENIIKDVAKIRKSPLDNKHKNRAILYIVKKRLLYKESI